MIKKKSARRKTFVCREDLINSLSEIAKARGRSLYETVNELFELALTSEASGLNLKRVVEERQLIENAKASCFILGPENLWYELADVAYEQEKTGTLKSWYDEGVWFAKRYTTSDVADPLENFKHDLVLFNWAIPEFHIEKTGALVRISSPRVSASYTQLYASFIKGALETFGFKITSSEVKQGIIRIDGLKEANVLG